MAKQFLQLLPTLSAAIVIISCVASAANNFELCDSVSGGNAFLEGDLTSKCRCVAFNSDVCTNYNWTVVPNYRGFHDLEDTEKEIQNFVQLISTGCSERLATFLCFFYYPVCDPVSGQYSRIPCRDFCLAVKKECKAKVKKLKWPRYLTCSRKNFPKKNCFDPRSAA